MWIIWTGLKIVEDDNEEFTTVWNDEEEEEKDTSWTSSELEILSARLFEFVVIENDWFLDGEFKKNFAVFKLGENELQNELVEWFVESKNPPEHAFVDMEFK